MTNYYALGRGRTVSWCVGWLDQDAVFHWTMDRGKFEEVISGRSAKHCDSCTCGQVSSEGSVIEDSDGLKYTRSEFMMVLLMQAKGEVR